MYNADMTLISKAKSEDNCDETEFFSVCSYEQTEDSYVISYEENADVGYESCKVCITVKNGYVEIQRSAPAPSIMTVEKGKKHHFLYGTPFGDFMMGINAFEVINELTPEGGRLYLRYSIDINSDFVSENELNMTVRIHNN